MYFLQLQTNSFPYLDIKRLKLFSFNNISTLNHLKLLLNIFFFQNLIVT